MREILFRGQRIDNGEWVEGWLYKRVVHLEGCHQNVVVDAIEVYDGESILSIEYYTVDPATVGQFTGITDKNDKRIFEGDIVKFRTRTSVFNKPLYVRWYGETAQFLVSLRDGVRSYPMDKSWEYEVIGNIHDNPELLNGGDAG